MSSSTQTDLLLSALPNSHITYEAEKAIQQMIIPLNKLGGIQYFNFGVKYADKSGYDLLSNTNFYESWFKDAIQLPSSYLKGGWYLCDSLQTPEVAKSAQAEDLSNFLIYIKHDNNKTTTFGFATHHNNAQIIDFYKNNLSLLMRFGHYFTNELGARLIHEAENQRFTHYSMMLDNQQPSIEPFLSSSTLSALNVLNDKEKMYLEYLVNGYSNADIGKILELSPKTVFKYVSTLRSKLGCKSKKEIYEHLQSKNIIQYYLNDNPEIEQSDFIHQLFMPISKLSNQEYNCYKFILKGYTIQEISNALQIKIPTVGDYINRLKVKLHCKSKYEIFALAFKEGFLSLG